MQKKFKFMEKPLVSIILPTYNRARFLEKAIKSVWTQTYSNMELIVVNDGSTDNTSEILDRLSKGNSKITIINNIKNLGIVAALNNGIKVAKGKYIARLDDDDFWDDDKKIEKQVSFLENNKDYVLVGGGVIKIDANNKEVSRYLLPEKDEDIRKSILIDNVFAHISVLFSKDAFNKVGGYDQDFLYVEDWDLWLKLGTIGKMYNFPEFFVRYFDQEYNNKNYYRNWGIRRNIKMNLRLKNRYKDKYPGYLKAVMVALANYIFSFLPFRSRIKSTLFKLRTKLFGSPYRY